MSGHTPLRLSAGDATRIMADNTPLCDIKCGGMSGRTVTEGERIAADIIARYNALEGLNPEAVADVVAALDALANVADDKMATVAETVAAIRTARTALARIRGEG